MSYKPMMKITPQEIREIDSKYKYQFDMFTDELDVQKAKWALSKLDIADRVIFELYTEFQSSRKVGAILGVSHNICLKEVRRIRAELLKIMKDFKE